MKVKFWGTRGSLPSTFTSTHLQKFLKRGIAYALDADTGIKPGQSLKWSEFIFLKVMSSGL